MFKPYDDVAKRIDKDLEKLNKEIDKLTSKRDALAQAKNLLLNGQQHLPLVKEKQAIDIEQKEKLKQAALLRHKKAREEKTIQVTKIIKENGAMTTTDLAEKAKISRGTIAKILKEGNFEKKPSGKWTVIDSEN